MSLGLKKWNNRVNFPHNLDSSTKSNINKKSTKPENSSIFSANTRISLLSPDWSPSSGSRRKSESKQSWRSNGWWGDRNCPKNSRNTARIFPQLRCFLLGSLTMSIFSLSKENVMCSHTISMSSWLILEIQSILLGLSTTPKPAIFLLHLRSGRRHATAILRQTQTWHMCNATSASYGSIRIASRTRKTLNLILLSARTVPVSPPRKKANDFFHLNFEKLQIKKFSKSLLKNSKWALMTLCQEKTLKTD